MVTPWHLHLSNLSHAAPDSARRFTLLSSNIYTNRAVVACTGSSFLQQSSSRSAYRYLNGRLATALALSIVPDIFLWYWLRRAKSMHQVSVGFSNPRDGVVVEAGRLSRGQQSLEKKPPKTLAPRLHRPKKHADTDGACMERGCIFTRQGIEALPKRL